MSDVTPPLITAFALPATARDTTVPVTSFTASDDTAVTGYLITTSINTPSAGDPGWSSTPPTSVTAVEGSNTFYAWAKDAAGNISAPVFATVVVTIVTGGGGGGIENTQTITPPLDPATFDFPQAVIDAIADAVAVRLTADHGAGLWQTGGGSGVVPVNHNTGGVDALRYLAPDSSPVADGGISAFLKSAYDSGDYSTPLGSTTTRSDGRWQAPLMLNAGVSYTLVFYKIGVWSATTATVTP